MSSQIDRRTIALALGGGGQSGEGEGFAPPWVGERKVEFVSSGEARGGREDREEKDMLVSVGGDVTPDNHRQMCRVRPYFPGAILLRSVLGRQYVVSVRVLNAVEQKSYFAREVLNVLYRKSAKRLMALYSAVKSNRFLTYSLVICSTRIYV